MRSGARKSFYYHADASSLGGFIEEPFQAVIPSRASVSLPAVGGYATTRTGTFEFKEIVSCRSAYTRVSGRTIERDGPWATLVTSVVEGLNILEIVTAERIVAQISIEHPREGGPAKVSFTGTHFERLRVGGQEVFPVLNSNLFAMGTGADNVDARVTWPVLLNSGQEQARELVQSIMKSNAQNAYEWAIQRYGWMESKHELQKDGCILCSLVDGVEGSYSGKNNRPLRGNPRLREDFPGRAPDLSAFNSTHNGSGRTGLQRARQVSACTAHINGSTMPPS